MASSPWTVRADGYDPGIMVADPDEVRRGLEVFVDPEAVGEIVSLDPPVDTLVPPPVVDGMVREVAARSTSKGVYFRLNPVRPGTDRPALNEDILYRRWVYVDVDPVHAEGFENDSATDSEKAAAGAVCDVVYEYLADKGWPAPVVTDSGNGFGLFYRCSLPNTPLVQAAVRSVLHTLAAKFSGPQGDVDRAVHNANRLAKVPGTWARKGRADLPDRPYRPARLIAVPATVEEVTFELLTATAEQPSAAPADRPPEAAPTLNGTPPHRSDRTYVDKAIEKEVARVVLAAPGERNKVLNDAAYYLGKYVAGGVLAREVVEERLLQAACTAGLDKDPGCGLKGIRATIASGLRGGAKAPKTGPPPQWPRADPVPVFGTNGHPATGAPAATPIIYWASEVTPRAVEWLWPQRIPLGKLTTFAGVGGLGKTFVLCDIAARVSRGLPWPDTPDVRQPPGKVLFISGEDEPDDTLVPRMMTLGADLSKIAFLTTAVQDRFTLADVGVLDAALEQMAGTVRFVAIDPPTAYLGGVNDHRNADLRQLLTPLKTFAARHRVALVFNTHVTKPQAGKVEAMMRVMGSVAWVNAVRSAHMFTRDPEDREKRLFVGMKNNLGPETKGLSYCLEVEGELARIKWLGEVDIDADDAINAKPPRKRSVTASAWLAEQFATGNRLESNAIWQAVKTTTISKNALKEAKDEMGIKAKQEADTDGEIKWYWTWSSEARANWSLRQEAEARSETQKPDPEA